MSMKKVQVVQIEFEAIPVTMNLLGEVIGGASSDAGSIL